MRADPEPADESQLTHVLIRTLIARVCSRGIMKPVVIDNPVINSPFEEPARHFRFTDEGITDEIVASRRSSSYFVPIPATKKQGRQLAFDTEWTRDRIEENRLINQMRFLARD